MRLPASPPSGLPCESRTATRAAGRAFAGDLDPVLGEPEPLFFLPKLNTRANHPGSSLAGEAGSM